MYQVSSFGVKKNCAPIALPLACVHRSRISIEKLQEDLSENYSSLLLIKVSSSFSSK